MIEKKISELSYDVVNLIFSEEDVFTVQEIRRKLADKGIDKSEKEIKFILEKLKEDGLVVKYGESSYRVNI